MPNFSIVRLIKNNNSLSQHTGETVRLGLYETRETITVKDQFVAPVEIFSLTRIFILTIVKCSAFKLLP